MRLNGHFTLPGRLRRDPDAGFVEFVDLLVVLLKSGRTIHQSFDCIARWSTGNVNTAARRVMSRCELGERLADAVGSLVGVFGPAAVGCANCLAAAERDGLPLAPVLERLVADGHAERRRRAQAEASKLPVKLAFPLVVCVLPSFVALTIVPILIGAIGSLSVGPLP